MNVITHGKYSYKRVCEDCGCEIEYSKTDIKHKTIVAAFQDIEYDDLYYINCPECDARIIIE